MLRDYLVRRDSLASMEAGMMNSVAPDPGVCDASLDAMQQCAGKPQLR
jgi:hypothetical protein